MCNMRTYKNKNGYCINQEHQGYEIGLGMWCLRSFTKGSTRIGMVRWYRGLDVDDKLYRLDSAPADSS